MSAPLSSEVAVRSDAGQRLIGWGWTASPEGGAWEERPDAAHKRGDWRSPMALKWEKPGDGRDDRPRPEGRARDQDDATTRRRAAREGRPGGRPDKTRRDRQPEPPGRCRSVDADDRRVARRPAIAILRSLTFAYSQTRFHDARTLASLRHVFLYDLHGDRSVTSLCAIRFLANVSVV